MFTDVIYAALDKKESSQSVIDLVKMMKTEIDTKFFEDKKKEFDYEDLFRILVQRRKIKLIRYLFSLPENEFKFEDRHFKETIEGEAYDIGALLYKEFFRKIKDSRKHTEQIITILNSSLNKNNGQIDFKAFLIKNFLDQFILRHAKHFLDTLDQKLAQENKFNILTLNLNVVKTACLLIEVLEQLGTRFERLRVRCQTMRQKIEIITKKYMNQVESESEMRYLLLEKDFENRDSLELITSYTISSFLESQFADNVVKEIWRSPYATNDQIFSASTNHRLTFEYFNCVKDEEQSSRFYMPKDVKSFEAHPMQFTVWRFSGKSRIIVEFISTAILASINHYFISNVLSQTTQIDNSMASFLNLENQYLNYPNTSSSNYTVLQNEYRNNYSSIQTQAEDFYQRAMIVSYLSFPPLMFAFQHIFNIVYASINRRMVNPYSFLNLLDLLIFGFYFTNIMVTYVYDLYGTWMDYPLIGQETLAMIYTRHYYGGWVDDQVIWILCIVILWVRVFYFLRFNEAMGKFVGIVERLLYDVALFFCFYMLELTFFTLIAELSFRTLSEYNTAGQAFKTLFYASMGQFDFTPFVNCQFGEYFGNTFMIIFLVCNIGLIMNLFIAVITVLYDGFSEHSNVYQMLETLKLRSHTQADKEYSALVSLPPPLNFLHVLFAPILLTSKNPQRINECILCIAYTPVMFGTTLLFIVYNLVLLPISYTKLFFHKLVMIYVYSKSYRVSRADKFIVFVFFGIIGPFTLFMNVIVDIWYFLKHLWMKELPKTQHKANEQQISVETLDKLSAYFKVRQEKMLSYKQVANDIRDLMGIMTYVGLIIKPTAIFHMIEKDDDYSKDNEDKRTFSQKHLDTMFFLIKEYNTIKQILDRNSELITIFETNQRVKAIDCKVMNTMISDLYRHAAVLKVEDEDFIFIRRAINIKSSKKIKDRRRQYVMDTDGKEERLSAQMETEGTKEQRKRQRIIFKKFLFLNTKRMLEIFSFKAGDTEIKKLMNSMKLDGSLQQEKKVQFQAFGSINAPSYDMDLGDLEEKVQQIGFVSPQLTNSLLQMKGEIQNLIHHLSSVQHHHKATSANEMEMAYQQKINELMSDLNNLKEEKQNFRNRQNIIEDYFYKRKESDKNVKNNKQEKIEMKPVRKQVSIVEPDKDKEDKEQFEFSQKHQKVFGQPSPQQQKMQQSESDIPDVEDDED